MEKLKVFVYLNVKGDQLVLLAGLLRNEDAQRDWTDRGHVDKTVEFWKVVQTTFLDEKRLIFLDRTKQVHSWG